MTGSSPTTIAPVAAGYPELEQRGYRIRLAESIDDLRRAQALRFEIFNLELGEGFQESYETGLDQDRYDPVAHHLLVEHVETGELVGTYRLQTRAMAEDGEGFYTAEEYDLSPLEPLFSQTAEASRACVHKDHREGSAIFLLWKGVARYMVYQQVRYLIGLTSLTSQDCDEGIRGWKHLQQRKSLHESLRVQPFADYTCAPPEVIDQANVTPLEKMPPLFDGYLALGTKIIGYPAIDREFGTIDYLALLDFGNLPPLVHRRFMP